MPTLSRREFLAATATAATITGLGVAPLAAAESKSASQMKLGLVTYLWGKDMKLPELISSCEEAGLGGVEVRTQHAHGVEPSLNAAERKDVRRRFADSSVELVGYGSNAEYHSNDPKKLQQNIELTKKYVQLMHDCGGSGVKVKPNAFVKGVPHEETIEQIGKSLNEVAAYGQKYGQEIRVEVHGRGTSELPVMEAIFEVADHPNVGVCWNSNDVDLKGKGLEHNFNLVKDRLASTTHVREFNVGEYPYDELFQLMKKANYSGWILLECRTNPKDKVAAMREQRRLFEEMTK
ncbi:sugar phosphate isomerase/epimerase family protein [Thalassoroseus pseudoceratinae]|uniref:sugar phosphate isomerase/epimerase family protein n=1 Tax=Thalassoroseus pseudoceratinae TaxID=2713176 RepID=UPI0014222BCC|nr:sugar phosphate isomerase/epimerase family protein [Thalassoroseus pseudoceratinae]